MFDVSALGAALNALNAIATAVTHARDLVLGPKLVLTVRPPATGTTIQAPDAKKFRHLEVRNLHRSRPAHNTQVFLKKLAIRRSDGSLDALWEDQEVRMWWAWERNDQGAPKSRTVGPPATCDLLTVTKGGQIDLQSIAGAWNFGDRFRLEHGAEYVVTFIARADEVDSEPFDVALSWNGEWDDDESVFAAHLQVRPANLALARVR